MSLLLHSFLLLALGLSSASAQQATTAGLCPTFQTSQYFDATKIGEVTRQGGYLVYMIAGSQRESEIKCLRLRIVEGNHYILQYVDQDQSVRNVKGDYIATPSGYLQPGSIELRGGDEGVFGADIFGSTTLFPILLGGNSDVYISCTSFGLAYTQSVYVMVPYFEDVSTRNPEEMVEFLKNSNVPLADKLKVADQSCEALSAIEAGAPVAGST